MLDEIKQEIVERHMPRANCEPVEKRRRRRRGEEMSPSEREEYRQKKIAEEEARMIKEGKALNAGCEVKKKRGRKRKDAVNIEEQKVGVKTPESPKMLQPLQPLYLLKIPGLPKGDCIAICYVRGAE